MNLVFLHGALWGNSVGYNSPVNTLDSTPADTHTLARKATQKPKRLNLVLLCFPNNWSMLQSIPLQTSNECLASSLQRSGDCYLIYRLNEQLLDAHTHAATRHVTCYAGTSCLSEGYESYSNDTTTCCQSPVCNVEGERQQR